MYRSGPVRYVREHKRPNCTREVQKVCLSSSVTCRLEDSDFVRAISVHCKSVDLAVDSAYSVIVRGPLCLLFPSGWRTPNTLPLPPTSNRCQLCVSGKGHTTSAQVFKHHTSTRGLHPVAPGMSGERTTSLSPFRLRHSM